MVYEKRRNARHRILREGVLISKTGLVDTTKGSLLTSNKSLRAAILHLNRTKAKNIEAENRNQQQLCEKTL